MKADKDFKYRIVEYCGTFRIQVYAYEIKGILWWKRKAWTWEPTNAWGGVQGIYMSSSGCFRTLKDARKMVRMWRRGYKYHKA